MTPDEQFNIRRRVLRENIPLEVQQLAQWTPTYPAASLQSTKAKRPFISTKEHDKLLTLQGAIDSTHGWSAPCYYGIVSIGTSTLSIIDVDDFYAPDSDEVSPLVSPGAKIIIEDLAARTYTETSLSGKGLHIFLNITDKPADKGYIKAARGWSGQLSLHNNFMVCTGAKLYQSPTTILTVSMRDLVALVRAPCVKVVYPLRLRQMTRKSHETLPRCSQSILRMARPSLAKGLRLRRGKRYVKTWRALPLIVIRA